MSRRCVGLLIVAAAGALALAISPAQGAEAFEELGAGGTVLGDISPDRGEADTFGVDLVAGSTLDVTLKAGFAVGLAVTDPDGSPFTVTLVRGRAKGLAVPLSGRYEVRVSATNTSGGKYTLKLKPKWAKKVTFEGTDAGSFPFDVPAGATVRASVRSAKGSTLVPTLAMTSPSEAVVVPERVATKNKVSFSSTPSAEIGTHMVVVGASAGSGAFRLVVSRKVPKPVLRKVDVRHGPPGLSFAKDGIGEILQETCVSCHKWPERYETAVGRGTSVVNRLRAKDMPRRPVTMSKADRKKLIKWFESSREP